MTQVRIEAIYVSNGRKVVAPSSKFTLTNSPDGPVSNVTSMPNDAFLSGQGLQQAGYAAPAGMPGSAGMPGNNLGWGSYGNGNGAAGDGFALAQQSQCQRYERHAAAGRDRRPPERRAGGIRAGIDLEPALADVRRTDDERTTVRHDRFDTVAWTINDEPQSEASRERQRPEC